MFAGEQISKWHETAGTDYLDEEVSAFVEKIASKKRIVRSSVVNELLRGDIKIAEVME